MSKKIEKFEDLIAWQKARKLTREIYRVTLREKFARGLWAEGSNSACGSFLHVELSRRI